MTTDVKPELLTARQAAIYMGVSKSYFEDHIRPHIAIVDVAREGAKQAMPRWSVTDLDGFIAARRREKKSA